MLKDDAPTYIIAHRKTGKTCHLSTNGHFTLCGWVMRDSWQRHDERAALFTVLLADAPLCRECKAKAQTERTS